MEVPAIEIDRDAARVKLQEFTSKRRRNLTEMDRALMRSYKALSEGLAIIDVNQAVKMGGQFEDNHCPKIAIARADLTTIFFKHSRTYEGDGVTSELTGSFEAWRVWDDWRTKESAIIQEFRVSEESQNIGLHRASINQGLRIELERGTLTQPEENWNARSRWFAQPHETLVPEIPFHLRPADELKNYFVLWEVKEWRPLAPADPLLLERIQHPLYIVVAQWDLTELEQKLLTAFRGR
jgi:hypothetical protein